MRQFASCNSCGSSSPQVSTGESNAIQEWEYEVVDSFEDQDLKTALNELGKKGWSLVTAGPSFIFKRPRIEEKKPTGRVGFAV
ncbi:MAG TPA: hypothetical protein DD435_16655 [Cyanobacteria bacterium UBA8530]|nr:hypothetical protein [Cyanobacteria bacterium UBA8530]